MIALQSILDRMAKGESALTVHHDLVKLCRELERPPCQWKVDSFNEGWDTACGNRFVIIDGAPTENEMKFCCYCGGRITEKE